MLTRQNEGSCLPNRTKLSLYLRFLLEIRIFRGRVTNYVVSRHSRASDREINWHRPWIDVSILGNRASLWNFSASRIGEFSWILRVSHGSVDVFAKTSFMFDVLFCDLQLRRVITGFSTLPLYKTDRPLFSLFPRGNIEMLNSLSVGKSRKILSHLSSKAVHKA